MSTITVVGSTKEDIISALGGRHIPGDIEVFFRGYDGSPLPGLRIRLKHDIYASREFETLDEAISYIRRLYKTIQDQRKANAKR